jgi:hypothetical protein
MAGPDWQGAEETLFSQSLEIIQRFALEHPEDSFSFFAYSVDSEFTGVGLMFDTPDNSLRQARAEERYRLRERNRLCNRDEGWKHAAYYVRRRIEDYNLRREFRHERVQFIELPVWEKFFYSLNEVDGPELEGRIIVAIWRVADRLIEAGAFDTLNSASPFRIGFTFHDDEMIVLRILNWPSEGGKGVSGGT